MLGKYLNMFTRVVKKLERLGTPLKFIYVSLLLIYYLKSSYYASPIYNYLYSIRYKIYLLVNKYLNNIFLPLINNYLYKYIILIGNLI